MVRDDDAGWRLLASVAVPRTSLTNEQALALLAETPRRIATLTKGLTEAQLHCPPERGEWSANEVLAHLRACADTRGEAIRTILASDNPTFRAVNPRTWIEQTDYLESGFRPSLRAYTKQRAGLVQLLEPLPRKAWARAATVTGAGRPLERTVLDYADWVVVHERTHLKQLADLVERV